MNKQIVKEKQLDALNKSEVKEVCRKSRSCYR